MSLATVLVMQLRVGSVVIATGIVVCDFHVFRLILPVSEQVECVHALKDWLCRTLVTLRRDHHVGPKSPAYHACGSARPFRTSCLRISIYFVVSAPLLEHTHAWFLYGGVLVVPAELRPAGARCSRNTTRAHVSICVHCIYHQVLSFHPMAQCVVHALKGLACCACHPGLLACLHSAHVAFAPH